MVANQFSKSIFEGNLHSMVRHHRDVVKPANSLHLF